MNQFASCFPTEFVYKTSTFKYDRDSTQHHPWLMRISRYVFKGTQIKHNLTTSCAFVHPTVIHKHVRWFDKEEDVNPITLSPFKSSSCSRPWWHSRSLLLQGWSTPLGTAVCQLWPPSTSNWASNLQNWPVATGWKWSDSVELLSNPATHYSFMRGQKLDQISQKKSTPWNVTFTVKLSIQLRIPRLGLQPQRHHLSPSYFTYYLFINYYK